MMCRSGKLGYANEHLADTALYMAKACRNKGETSPVRYYKCPDCGYWHLTHREEDRPVKIAVLVPAYGRDYSTASSAIKDFRSGKDWILRDPTSRYNGKYCSIRDLSNSEYTEVELRYNKRRDLAKVNL